MNKVSVGKESTSQCASRYDAHVRRRLARKAKKKRKKEVDCFECTVQSVRSRQCFEYVNHQNENITRKPGVRTSGLPPANRRRSCSRSRRRRRKVQRFLLLSRQVGYFRVVNNKAGQKTQGCVCVCLLVNLFFFSFCILRVALSLSGRRSRVLLEPFLLFLVFFLPGCSFRFVSRGP